MSPLTRCFVSYLAKPFSFPFFSPFLSHHLLQGKKYNGFSLWQFTTTSFLSPSNQLQFSTLIQLNQTSATLTTDQQPNFILMNLVEHSKLDTSLFHHFQIKEKRKCSNAFKSWQHDNFEELLEKKTIVGSTF